MRHTPSSEPSLVPNQTVDAQRRAIVMWWVASLVSGCMASSWTQIEGPSKYVESRDDRDFGDTLLELGYTVAAKQAIELQIQRQIHLAWRGGNSPTEPMRVIYTGKRDIIPEWVKSFDTQLVWQLVPSVRNQKRTSFKDATGVSIGAMKESDLETIAMRLHSGLDTYLQRPQQLSVLLSHFSERDTRYPWSRAHLVETYRAWLVALRSEAQYAQMMWRMLLHLSGLEAAEQELIRGRDIKNATRVELYNSFAVYGNVMCRFGRWAKWEIPYPMKRMTYRNEMGTPYDMSYYFFHIEALFSWLGRHFPNVANDLEKNYGRAVMLYIPTQESTRNIA